MKWSTINKYNIFVVSIIWFMLIVWYYKFKPLNVYVVASDMDSRFKSTVHRIIQKTTWPVNIIYNKYNADVVVKLVTSKFLDTFNNYSDGCQIQFSYTVFSTPRTLIYINEANWFGVPESGLTTVNYQEYIINHEIGHALGYDHVGCNADTAHDNVCPVMYQSTVGCPSGFTCGHRAPNF